MVRDLGVMKVRLENFAVTGKQALNCEVHQLRKSSNQSEWIDVMAGSSTSRPGRDEPVQVKAHHRVDAPPPR